MSDLFTNSFDLLFRVLLSSGKAELLACLGALLGLMALLVVVGKVPLSYNVRNLQVRWITTALTAPFATMRSSASPSITVRFFVATIARCIACA